MTENFVALGGALVLVYTLGHALFALTKGTVIIAGQRIYRKDAPRRFWSLVGFDVFVLIFGTTVLVQIVSGKTA